MKRSEDHVEAWRRNLDGKAKEVQSIIDEVLSLLPLAGSEQHRPKFDKRLADLVAKTNAMHDMFGPGLVPETLLKLSRNLESWRQNPRSPDVTRKIAALYDSIGNLNGDDVEELSFTQIIERHRRDENLGALLEELISQLEQLIDAGDDVLTRQVAFELERILVELKKRKEQSLFDIQPWIEFALVAGASVADHYYGNPVASIAVAATLAAKKSQIRVFELLDKARRDYIESLCLKGTEKWDGLVSRKLTHASLEEIKNALHESKGLDRLPQPVGEESKPVLLSGEDPKS